MSNTDATIIRVASRRDNPYVLISRAVLQDASLSYEARGLLAYLLSKPDNWTVQINDLTKTQGCGRDKVYRILKELIKARYVSRKKYRDANGTWVWEPYYVYETPKQPYPENPYTEKQEIIHSTESYILTTTPADDTAGRLRRTQRRKRAKARKQKYWLTLPQSELQHELTKYRNYARAKPNVYFFQECVEYLLRLVE